MDLAVGYMSTVFSEGFTERLFYLLSHQEERDDVVSDTSRPLLSRHIVKLHFLDPLWLVEALKIALRGSYSRLDHSTSV